MTTPTMYRLASCLMFVYPGPQDIAQDEVSFPQVNDLRQIGDTMHDRILKVIEAKQEND